MGVFFTTRYELGYKVQLSLPFSRLYPVIFPVCVCVWVCGCVGVWVCGCVCVCVCARARDRAALEAAKLLGE